MKLSIITINRNNADGLRRTMESVLNQTCKDFEYIVVDGASDDGSVEVMEEVAEKIVQAGIIINAKSEPDLGLYNAMNKGVKQCVGEYVLMLNSGDWFVDENVVEKIMPLLDGIDIIQGNVVYLIKEKQKVYGGCGRSDIDFIDVQKGHFLHQASFCRRDLFDKYGLFDESYQIAGDTVFYIKVLGYGNATFKYIDLNIAFFDGGGRSSQKNDKWANIRTQERKRLSKELFSIRLWNTCIEYDKKGNLYDKLHRHKWAWYIVMALVTIINRIEKWSLHKN